jgi:hypothetical protein
VLTKHKNQKQHTQTMYEEDGGDQGGTWGICRGEM